MIKSIPDSIVNNNNFTLCLLGDHDYINDNIFNNVINFNNDYLLELIYKNNVSEQYFKKSELSQVNEFSKKINNDSQMYITTNIQISYLFDLISKKSVFIVLNDNRDNIKKNFDMNIYLKKCEIIIGNKSNNEYLQDVLINKNKKILNTSLTKFLENYE